MSLEINPIEIDCKNLRIERQKENNKILLQYILEKNHKKILENCNELELNRTIQYLEINLEDILNKCATDITFAKLLVSKISKNASRQGTKDEIFILDKCNETTKKIGIKIEKLSQIAYRPSKLGKILNHKEVKKAKLNKIDCLKSFDGKISGKCNGWIFSKIVFTAGGHQDNVFEEAYQLCEWVETFEKKDKTLYALIIDTDLEKSLNDLRNKYKNNKNIFIGNHIDFQRYLIKKYN